MTTDPGGPAVETEINSVH